MPLRPESLVVSAGRPHEPGAPISTPIVLTAPYRNDEAGKTYARSTVTDTIASFEQALGDLETGTALAFASGMAALATFVESRPLGQVAVVPRSAYSGAVTIFHDAEASGRMQVRRVDVADTAAVVEALEGADLLWLETVTNPLLAVPDLAALIAAAHDRDVLVGVDATLSTPLVVRPLSLGADLVMHSATKYLAGHSDVLMGALVTRSPELHEALWHRRTFSGGIPGALEAYLALRGMRTLALRMERAQSNALTLAQRLAEHPRVTRVRFPGLPSDPGHEVAARQYDGYGAMISFDVDGDAEAAQEVCRRLRLITNATSLGGVESVIERRAQYQVDADTGTPANLLRFSVGIEHVEDLWADLAQALD